MKKFYYNKDTSQDESPNVFTMERRDTIDINHDQGRGMSSRAASVNSLDHLMSEAPTIPRVQTRDMTRSFSDAATRSQSEKQKLVTETELSSSWLYKTMQASINARFKSPRKSPSVHKSEDLEQSILQDPELKPIPVKSKATKTTSCMCYFATMIAISLCTVGFLASVAAIIYMEIFADRNITSLHTPEAEVDLSDVVMDSLEIYNLTHNVEGEERILNEARTHRFDGDEEILNEAMKASSTNDIPSLSNLNKSEGVFSDYVTDVGNPKKTELKPYIHDTNSKIKFQDGVTVIYEMKEETTKNDVESDFSDKFKGRSFGFESEDDSKDSFDRSTESVENNLKEEDDVNTKLDRTIQNDSLLLDNSEDTDKSHNFTLNKNPLKDLKEIVLEDEFKLKSGTENIKVDTLENSKSKDKIIHGISLLPEKFNLSEIFQSQSTGYEKDYNIGLNGTLFGGIGTDNTNKSDTYNNTQLSKDSDAVLTNLSDFRTEQYEDGFRPTPEVDHPVTDEHDVNTMLVTIDDTDVSTESFISNRNGDINLFHVSSPVPSVEPVKQINDNSFSPKKTVDMKVSLADAMKHLQKLDVNSKLLTSRTKPKQKGNAQKPKRKTTFNNDEEKKRYLQRMRLMLFKHLQ